MPAKSRMPASWSRRSLLVALAAGSVTALSGCRVQRETGTPLVRTRVPMKDEAVLVAMLGRTELLRLLAEAGGGPLTSLRARLGTVHADQFEVIASVLREGGGPEPLIGEPPKKPLLASVAALSAAERSSMTDVVPAALSPAHIALIGSLLAQRTAAVVLLGGTAAPALPSGLKGAEAARMLAAARACVYGFEVVAAQIGKTGRAQALATLATLETRASELQTVVGSTGAPRPVGYELPFPVTNTASARRLALHLLAGLLASQAAGLGPAKGDLAALSPLIQWLGSTEVAAHRWGAPLSAFPGLTNR